MISSKKKLSVISDIYDRDGRKCWYCEKELLSLVDVEKDGKNVPENYPTIEHIIPRVIGGGDALANLRVSCPPCNNAKGYELPLDMIDGMSNKQLIGLLRITVGKNMKLLVEAKTLKQEIKNMNMKKRKS